MGQGLGESAILITVVAHEVPVPGTGVLHGDWGFTTPVHPEHTIKGLVEVLELRPRTNQLLNWGR